MSILLWMILLLYFKIRSVILQCMLSQQVPAQCDGNVPTSPNQDVGYWGRIILTPPPPHVFLDSPRGVLFESWITRIIRMVRTVLIKYGPYDFVGEIASSHDLRWYPTCNNNILVNSLIVQNTALSVPGDWYCGDVIVYR